MRIVLSYRRSDSAAIAGRIFDRLANHYGEDNVFMDIDSIPVGVDFRDHIRKELNECNVLLAVIGPQWAVEREISRIKNEADFVRIEIETALQRNIPVVPLLVDETPMPEADQLPETLQPLAFRNAAPVDSGRDFHPHMDRLIRELDRLCGSSDAIVAPESVTHAAETKAGREQRSRHSGAERAQTTADAAQGRSGTEDGQPWRPSRRKVVQWGLGGLGLASGAGILLAGRAFLQNRMPSLESVTFDLVTVNDRGERNPPEQRTIRYFTQPLGADESLQLAMIPAGDFIMGSPFDETDRRENEGPQHLVKLPLFAISRTAITQTQWNSLLRLAPDKIKRDLPLRPSFFQGATLPVETISWQDAVEFCDRLSHVSGLSYRLPTEAEWEYACRAETMSPFHFGPTLTGELANYCGTGGAVRGTNNGQDISSSQYDGVSYGSGAYGAGPVGLFRGETTPVGSFPPNGFGLHDMHGNVWEHCLDTWHEHYRDASPEGKAYLEGRPSRRVLRGGSWSHHPAICRSAYRDAMEWDIPGWQGRVGLRIVCEVPGSRSAWGDGRQEPSDARAAVILRNA